MFTIIFKNKYQRYLRGQLLEAIDQRNESHKQNGGKIKLHIGLRHNIHPVLVEPYQGTKEAQEKVDELQKELVDVFNKPAIFIRRK